MRKPPNKHRKIIPGKFCNFPKRKYTFTLGEIYIVVAGGKRRCQFIKVTPKGFNLLDLDRSKCIIKNHLYDSLQYSFVLD